MSFQICIKTAKSLRQLASEIRDVLSLPPFTESVFDGAPYCQFEVLGMLILLHETEKEERDPEVSDFPYAFDLQAAFMEHDLNTDPMEELLQPYYAQLLSFHLNVETAYREKKQIGQHWQVRYCYLQKNPQWDGSVLFGEAGWEPAVRRTAVSPWRTMLPPAR
ncbi:hypothetical protein EI42_04139 [Thermosporothrix hazakensis]|jgi:hypothetical protein|uniref:Uncharacterized protein n=2 Tax=Thermosporothrix TaxID=768650 RepID=A0A326U647_THEHA|nr:hypothetical protein [Thermosporothrix hazakensis]PZW25646.1 hypothetical protein EI42_04139 [Thermosporothrix hazakensis]BBH89942.1 hypothetical protein KTC_46930 [Thermosporothrix sp. COM3]GCE48141.1 hypothetical protein KTH_30100 [Thermosporothrix hazakensis]